MYNNVLYADNLFAEQQQINKRELTELSVLHQFYKDLQNGILIDELLPSLVTKRVITITDKVLITESGKSTNERCQFFLDQYISKPLSTGNPSAFNKLLQLMDESSKYTVLAAKIKQSLMTESLQDKISGTYVDSYMLRCQYITSYVSKDTVIWVF